ncbi:LacI family DNA-binding transcriptional regulator [Microbacterium sp. NPDC077391]|uniref:LacI family DNA-binding transcriptional regulator n=1 Tax=unclassified Microbacterium TaxID=2609290 RepID=UPI0028B1B0DF|nr:LacI family DNA-binding transcriptional regulator [Microbacterium sp.]
MGVSVRDVARQAGVSVGTVSNVLNHPERVTPQTVERVQRVIAEIGFVRNDAARQLRAGRSRSIGLVVLDIGNPFFAEVARGAEDRAAQAGMTVLVGNSDESSDRERLHLALFREQRVNGVLVTPTTDNLSLLHGLLDSGVPVVLVDRQVEDGGFTSVAMDDVEGGRMATAHLLEIGRRRLAFVAGPQSIGQVADRLQGARAAVNDVPGASLEVVERSALSVLQGRLAGESLLERAPADRPDAVFAANDLLAVGLLQSFGVAGVRVPDDIALVGYDDIDFATATMVPLSSVRQPARMIGEAAVELLLGEISGEPRGRAVRFQPELVVRQSTAG